MIRFSEALADEVSHNNVKVVAVCPGFTYSEFHDVTGTRESVARLPEIFWLSAGEVVEQTIKSLETKTKTVFVPGKFNRFLVTLNTLLPVFAVKAILNRYSHVARIRD